MTDPFDEYQKLETPAVVVRCPVCGGPASLWQYQKSADGPASKVVMCDNGEAFGPQDGMTNEGCLLYMPPDGHYKARILEAVNYWNDYAKALNTMRRGNNWKTARVTRAAASIGKTGEPT